MCEGAKLRRRRVVGIVAVVVVVGSLIPLAATRVGYLGLVFSVHRRQVQLLCRTDHGALLKACQELSRQVVAGELPPGRYRMRGEQKDRTLKLPEVIRKLRPTVIAIKPSGRIVIVMAGGLSGFGVSAYPDGYQKPYASFEYGDRELIPNLWYFDDQYVRDAEYDKVIDGIFRRYGSAKDETANEDTRDGP